MTKDEIVSIKFNIPVETRIAIEEKAKAERKLKRDELLDVAKHLAAGICASVKGNPSFGDYKEVNTFAVEIAKDLITKVDAEFKENNDGD